ncbi:diguanylate cyclase domain-containing protein [Rhizobium terrae]|uniref:diguanylate cyclase domain-containing protein n=1 Tax=Rhizobium terrae TaxID=2171756 RepID=UPI000E3CC08D|nr:diguanylate cyclase [Rhizobium terrae]
MLGAEVILLLENCPLPVFILDAAGLIVFANGTAREFFDLDDVSSGRAIAEFFPEWPLNPAPHSRYETTDRSGRSRSCDVRVTSWQAGDASLSAIWIETAEREAPAGLALREANLRLRYVIEMLPQAVCVFDSKDRYVLWNRKYAELYAEIAEHLRPGIAFEDILRISLASGSIREVVGDQDAWLRQRMTKFRQPVAQEEHQLQDGRWLRYDDRRTPDGGAIGIRIDITELKQREEWLRQLFEANPMPMLLCDGNSLAILEANHAAMDFYGFGRSDLLSKKAHDMHAPGESEVFAARLSGLTGDCEARTVWRQQMADGRERHVMIYVRLLHERSEHRLLLTIADVSERVLAEAEATRLAHHDVLTGLPNRIQFYKSLDESLQSGKPGRTVVYCLDLDGFKPVNDTFGHAAGDELLKLVGERLKAEAGGNMVARLGGDEFAILMKTEGALDTGLADRCIAAFKDAFVIKGLPISIGVSIGIAAAGAADHDRDGLVHAADRALYRAKAAGRNTWRIDSEEDTPSRIKRA